LKEASVRGLQRILAALAEWSTVHAAMAVVKQIDRIGSAKVTLPPFTL